MCTEFLDIVDINDAVIGQLSRDLIYKNKLSNFRTVNGFLLNSLGELWIPTRQLDKDLWPLHLDASIGGHVQAGETYEEAFSREAKEELNLDLTIQNVQDLGKLTPIEHNVTSYMKLFLIITESSPTFNLLDFIKGEWLSSKDIKDKFKQGTLAKPDLPILIKFLESRYFI